MIGASLGPYEILEQLGAGGMGEVYLAEDTRLGRKVAVKVLPAEFASDPERLARFEREARAAAALNHPHIAVVHDVGAEQADGDGATVHFMVQEFLDGHTLRGALSGGALPVKKAVELATEMAEALAAAHQSYIVHRDLKPANVFVTHQGHAKVLDFGLAKLLEPDDPSAGGDMSRSPTMLGTVAGQVMGTAGYMAPEQVRGEDIDARADIFAFGCLLYEMATGKQAFSASSALDTLHAIVHDDPQPLAQINPALPAELQRIVRKCLAKDAEARYQTARGLATDLRSLGAELEAGTAVAVGSGTLAADAVERPTGTRAVSWPLAVAALVVVAGVAGLAGWFLRPAPADEHLKVFEIDLGPGASISSRGLIVSPDGRTIAFAGVQSTTQPLRMLYVRRLDQTGFTALAGTEDAIYPFFSPGGDWIGFVTRGPSASGEGSVDALKKVSLAGGDPFTLCSCYGVGTWADDGNIYYAEGRTIWRVPAAGGDPQPLLTPPDDEPDTWYFRPTALPGGRALLFELFRGAPGSTVTGERNIATVDLDELQIHEVVVDGSDPRYSRTGHIVYGRNNALFAVPFDAAELTVTGEPTPVRQEVRLNNTGMVPAGISADGTLVYQPGVLAAGADARYALVWVDRSGRKERVSERRGNFGAVRLSPDGRRVALEDGTSSQRGIWILGIDDGSFAPLNNEGLSLAPLWSPDGSKVYFNWEAEVTGQSVGARGGIYARDADFGAPREQILETEGGVFPHSWSADGEDLVLHEMIEGESRRRILVMPVAGEDRTAFSPYDASGQFNQRSPVVSPDGRWVAYVSEQSGRDEVYVRPFPDSGPRVQISDNGGVEPMWGADSSELFYREIDLSLRTTMIAAALDIQETPRVAGRTELFSGFYWFMATNRARTTFDYDRANDRFLMVDAAPDEGDEESPNARINVLVDWFPELERQVPGGR